MTKTKIWFLAITAALGGFLFGFDTIVINGAEQDIQKLWNLSGQMHGWVVSAALWGTVIGSIAGGKVSDRFGRKNTLFGVGILFFVSAVWSAFAAGPWSMIIARFIGGLRCVDDAYEVKLVAWYDSKADATIFDAEIGGARTMICRRAGKFKEVSGK